MIYALFLNQIEQAYLHLDQSIKKALSSPSISVGDRPQDDHTNTNLSQTLKVVDPHKPILKVINQDLN